VTELALEFGVNRKTIRRRLDALELVEAERTGRIAAERFSRWMISERRKERERAARFLPEPSRRAAPGRRTGPRGCRQENKA
jgi:hypothetical protein